MEVSTIDDRGLKQHHCILCLYLGPVEAEVRLERHVVVNQLLDLPRAYLEIVSCILGNT